MFEQEMASSKRENICKEILQVEENYVEALRTLEVEIRVPLLRKLGSQADKLNLRRIFGNVKIILELNQTLLLDLKDADEHSIGSIFLKFAPFLKMYTAYLNHTEDSLNLLQEAKKKSRMVKEFCAAQRVSLESLLIRPVQQIPRYVMLLKELLKHTPARHADRSNIEEAMNMCARVATHCNTTITKQKNFIKTVEVNERFRGQGLKDCADRQIVKEGNVEKINRRGIPEQRVFVLFSDALAYGTGTVNEDVKLHRTMYMGDFGIFESKGKDDDDLRSFEIRSKSKGFGSRAKAFIVRCANEAERLDWVAAIRKSMEAAGVDSKQKFAALWSHDTKECEVCDQSFSFLRRRHHCRACGKCVCGNCSPNEWILEHVSNKPQRVCNMCYVKLKQRARDERESSRVRVVTEGVEVEYGVSTKVDGRRFSSDVSGASLVSAASASSDEGRMSKGRSDIKRRSTRPPPPLPRDRLSSRRAPPLPRTRPPSRKTPPVRPKKSTKPKLRPSIAAPKPPCKERKRGVSTRQATKKNSIEALRGASIVSKMMSKSKVKRRPAPQKKVAKKNNNNNFPPRRKPSLVVRNAALRSSVRRMSTSTGQVPSETLLRKVSAVLSPSALGRESTAPRR